MAWMLGSWYGIGVDAKDRISEIRGKFAALRDGMSEAFRRRWAGVEAQSLGYGVSPRRAPS